MPGYTITAAKTFGWLSGSQMEKKWTETGMVAEGENNSQQEE